MRFTLSWLKEHLDTEAGPGELAGRLTLIGLEVDSVTDRGRALEGFVVGLVTACDPHPGADRLKVCRVDTGDGEHRVVCGAPNARAGMKGVFAPLGAIIPATGKRLKRGRIRGVDSEGMLCSAFELGVGEDRAGIVELPANAVVGSPAAAALGVADPLFDLDLTPNRSDCLGINGIARDLAAAGLGRFKPRRVAPVPGRFPSPIGIRLDFPRGKEDACPLFVGRVIRGLGNRESPKWLRDRLEAIGLRPISALVDITNFLTFDRCRPLHVFDADRVKGDLVVRLAKKGESLLALDGERYELDPEMTVIADETGVLSLGGVIGGVSTGCTDGTTSVIVEAALFDPLRTARTGRMLGIESDARHRFERGVDPASTIPGVEEATRLILTSCGGEPSTLAVAGEEPRERRRIRFDPERVRTLGGVDLPAERSFRILRDLGFAVEAADGAVRVTVPFWRRDVEGEADLVEEVVRIHGYERVPVVSLPPVPAGSRPDHAPAERRAHLAKRLLAERGLLEAVTWSFTSSRDAELFGGVDPSLRLANPISANLDVMRPSLLPNLIAALARNADRGVPEAALFEVGPQYVDDTAAGQRLVAAGVRGGASGMPHWSEKSRAVDAFDAKADAVHLLEGLGVAAEGLRIGTDAPAWYHPGRSGTIRLAPQLLLAWFGEIHPGVLGRMAVRGPVVGFEAFLDALPAAEPKAGRARPPLRLSRFPAVERDFAFVVDERIAAADVVEAARSAAKGLASEAAVFDVYTGPGLEPGKKSLAIRVRLEPRERTMTEAEIDDVARAIVGAVGKATGGVLRG